jgi:hypothetical protein
MRFDDRILTKKMPASAAVEFWSADAARWRDPGSRTKMAQRAGAGCLT